MVIRGFLKNLYSPSNEEFFIGDRTMNSEIGRTSIDEKIRMRLWGVAAGRCEMCNRLLYQDTTFGVDGNFSESAHIHAVSPGGPRYKREMTQQEKNDISNLMLLCEEHHHMIDSNPELFGDSKLINIKAEHERHIRNVTAIRPEQSCRMVSYFSNIDHQEVFSDEKLFRQALIAYGRFPMQQPVIELHAQTGTRYIASKPSFEAKALELEASYYQWFNSIIKQEESVAVFSLAPQPLLIKLGTLLSDQNNVISFQCHREGHKWAWKDIHESPEFIIKRPINTMVSKVALVVDLSAPILDDRITSTLGEDTYIYHITNDSPNRSFVKCPEVQENFITAFRVVMEEIKNLRPQPDVIHVFPVMPNSLAIRLGMDYMPKTDIPMLIYEQENAADGFFETIMIGG